MSNKFKTDCYAAELRHFRRGVELQRTAERPAWRAPWPAQPPSRKAVTNAEADDLLLRATIAAAIRKGNAP